MNRLQPALKNGMEKRVNLKGSRKAFEILKELDLRVIVKAMRRSPIMSLGHLLDVQPLHSTIRVLDALTVFRLKAYRLII